MKITIPVAISWELTKHPLHPQIKNVCIDCPHCGSEHFYTMLAGNLYTVQVCDSDSEYIFLVKQP